MKTYAARVSGKVPNLSYSAGGDDQKGKKRFSAGGGGHYPWRGCSTSTGGRWGEGTKLPTVRYTPGRTDRANLSSPKPGRGERGSVVLEEGK